MTNLQNLILAPESCTQITELSERTEALLVLSEATEVTSLAAVTLVVSDRPDRRDRRDFPLPVDDIFRCSRFPLIEPGTQLLHRSRRFVVFDRKSWVNHPKFVRCDPSKSQ